MKKTGYGLVWGLLAAFSTAAILSVPAVSYGSDVGGEGEPKKIMVLPWKLNASDEKMGFLAAAAVEMLTTRIGASPGLEIVNLRAESAQFEGPVTALIAEEAATEAGADYVLFGSITVLGNSLSLDAKLVTIESGRVEPMYASGVDMESLVAMIDDLAGKVVEATVGRALGEEQKSASKSDAAEGSSNYTGIFAKAPAEPAAVIPPVAKPGHAAEPGPETTAVTESGETEKTGVPVKGIIKSPDEDSDDHEWRSDSTDEYFKSIEAADLDGDGSDEIFVMTQRDILVYRIVEGGVEKIDVIKGDKQVTNVSLAAIDANGDGRAELYVSRLRANIPSGIIVEYKNGSYAVTASKIKWFMRVLKGAGGSEDRLIGQPFRISSGLYRRVIVLEREPGGGLVERGPLSVPKYVSLYGFEVLDLDGDGDEEFLSIEEHGHLVVYERAEKGWERVWKSTEYYGGTLNVVELGDHAISTSVREFVLIRDAVLFTDLDAQGSREIIVKINTSGSAFGNYAKRSLSFKKGEILGLEWRGDYFKELWRTREVGGYVSGLALVRSPDGSAHLIIAVVEGITMLSKKPRSHLVSFKLF